MAHRKRNLDPPVGGTPPSLISVSIVRVDYPIGLSSVLVAGINCTLLEPASSYRGFGVILRNIE